MDSPVRSSTHTTTESASTTRSYLKGIYAVSSATAGTLTLTNGSGGATVMTIATPAAVGAQWIDIPGRGILFENGIEIGGVLTNITSVTLFYDG